MTKFSKSRFHKEYGPKSLFERIEFKMKDVNNLKLHGKHFKQRLKDREIPQKVLKEIELFDKNKWKVVTAEVRNDKGKFVNSTWEYEIDSIRYWITVGFNDTVQTIIIKDSSGLNNIVKDGQRYDFVDKVNKELMEE